MRTIYNGTIRVSVNHGGKYIGTKPRSVQFGEHTISVRNWTDMLQKMCDKIAAENPNDFSLVLKRLEAEDAPYFEHFTRMNDPSRRPYEIGSTALGVRCNLSANNIYELCKALSQLFGYKTINVQYR